MLEGCCIRGYVCSLHQSICEAAFRERYKIELFYVLGLVWDNVVSLLCLPELNHKNEIAGF